jgi:hypothetical protein
MTSAHILLKDNDMVLEVSGLQNKITGAYLNAAAVAVSLADAAGVAVTGQTWPLALTYVAASDGVYRATLEESLGICKDAEYIATVTVDAGAGLKGAWVLNCIGALRDG